MRRITNISIVPVSKKVATVAIGSSSTEGVGASTPDSSYPSVLEQLLAARSDVATFTVFNKGMGGDTLPGTQARLQRDVFDLRPQFVIVQVGTNDAIDGQSAAALADFTDRLRTVVSTVKARVPLVLMNGQHYPTEPADYLDYQNAIEQVGQEQDVPVFDRYALMKSWVDSGKYRFADILSSDSFHPNDVTYRCMAQVIADVIITRTLR